MVAMESCLRPPLRHRFSFGHSPRTSFMRAHNGVKALENSQIYGSELMGFAQRVAACNSGLERKSEFLPFKLEDFTLGYIHHRMAQQLKRFSEVFWIEGEDGVRGRMKENLESGYVTLAPSLSSLDLRTDAVEQVLQVLRNEGLIKGWRNEMYPVARTFGEQPFLLIERAAAKLFGVRAYGVHMNGFATISGQKHLWVARRSETKATYAGMLDHLVAGGQPHGISCKANIIKECDEEAGVPQEIAEKAVAAGVVSYDVIHGESYTRDVLFCYDLELPVDFQPYNKDGEVQSFTRLPVLEVLKIIRDTEQYKPNCALVIIDFLVRHGYITPEQKGYLRLLQSLRSGGIM